MLKTEKNYLGWIRKKPCYFGGSVSEIANCPNSCSQNWDMDSGEFSSQVSHILKRKSVRIKEGKNHIGNIFPNCDKHHKWYEFLAPELKETFAQVGLDYYQEYRYEIVNSLQKRK